ncbi:MAG TPA: metallophosphoesterase family protein [Chitinophagaceae bacterium]
MKTVQRFIVLLLLFFPFKNYSQNSSPPLAKGDERFTNKPKLVRGPYLQAATDTSMVVRWRTDVLTRSRVRYGTSPNKLDKTMDGLTQVTEHEIKLTGLSPNSKYYYSVGSLKDTLQYGADNYFSTLPVPGTEGFYRVGVFGDCGYLSINQANVRDQMLKYLGRNDLNAWILLGDNAYNDGNDMEYQAKFFNPFKDNLLKKYPVFPSPGNHDYHDADFGYEYAQTNHTTAYYQNFSMPINGEAGGVPSGNPAFYSFDIGNIHFISLDSYGIEENKYFLYDTLGPQVQWLKKDLAANKNKGWVVVYFHYPPYSKGTHDSDEKGGIMANIRENVIGILERNNVDLVLTGHSHVYERSRMMKEHYGLSSTFDPQKHNLSSSSGKYESQQPDAPYIKNQDGKGGTVYVVSGTAAYVGKFSYDYPHKAMYYSNDSAAGSAILEVQGNRLDFKWICADGVIRDQFTMMKDVNKKSVIKVKLGERVKLSASFISNSYTWNKSKQKEKSIEVLPPMGKTVYTVKDGNNYLQDIFEVIVSK